MELDIRFRTPYVQVVQASTPNGLADTLTMALDALREHGYTRVSIEFQASPTAYTALVVAQKVGR